MDGCRYSGMAVLLPLFFLAQVLSNGTLVERELPAKETHSYTIHLEARQFIRWTIDSRGAAVVASLSDPSGQPVIESSYSYFAIAGATGDYRLDLKPANTGGSHYRLRLEEARAATPADELL